MATKLGTKLKSLAATRSLEQESHDPQGEAHEDADSQQQWDEEPARKPKRIGQDHAAAANKDIQHRDHGSGQRDAWAPRCYSTRLVLLDLNGKRNARGTGHLGHRRARDSGQRIATSLRCLEPSDGLNSAEEALKFRRIPEERMCAEAWAQETSTCATVVCCKCSWGSLRSFCHGIPFAARCKDTPGLRSRLSWLCWRQWPARPEKLEVHSLLSNQNLCLSRRRCLTSV